MCSNRKAENKILGVVSPARAEQFLRDLANADMDRRHRDALRLQKKYPEMAKPVWKSPEEWAGDLAWLQLYLQCAWDAPDERHRTWYLFSMRKQYSHSATEVALRTVSAPPEGTFSFPAGFVLPNGKPMLNGVHAGFIEPPQITPFEAAAFYFQSRIGDRAKHCASVDCPAPYFIAEKRWQKFCTEKCAGSANRESKRKWWHENKAKKGHSI